VNRGDNKVLRTEEVTGWRQTPTIF